MGGETEATGRSLIWLISYNLSSLLFGSQQDAQWPIVLISLQSSRRNKHEIRLSEMSESSRVWTLNILRWQVGAQSPFQTQANWVTFTVFFGGSVEGPSGVQIQVRANREPKFMFDLSSNSAPIQFGLVLHNRTPPKNDKAHSGANGVPALLLVTNNLH